MRVSLAPGWMTSISFSIPCPSTSKPCGMLPAFVIANVTVPAATLACDSSTFHSDSFTVIWTGAVACFRLGAAPSASATTKSPETFLIATPCN